MTGVQTCALPIWLSQDYGNTPAHMIESSTLPPPHAKRAPQDRDAGGKQAVTAE